MADTLFFVLSKIFWLLVSPGSLLILLFSAGGVCMLLHREKTALRIFSTGLCLLLLIYFLPLGEWLAAPLENRYSSNPILPPHISGIMVLGGSENLRLSSSRNTAELNHAAERLIYFAALARAHPSAQLVHSGGSGLLTDIDMRESQVSAKIFHMMGLDTSRIFFEDTSRNTYENIYNTYTALEPQKNENWILITSAAHMVRAVKICENIGWNVIPFPVDHRSRKNTRIRITMNFAHNLALLEYALREWLGLGAYFFTGKTQSVLP
ncbi:MAG: YdcF family protein [Fibrobacterota bacterium]